MTFNPGKSGNPGGRPPGSLNKRTQLAKLFEPYAEELVNKAVELARGGDVQALRLCLERLIPKATQEPAPLDISAPNHTNLANFGSAILAAVTNGVISCKDGQTLSVLLENQRKLIEHVDLRHKLDDIELAIKQGRG